MATDRRKRLMMQEALDESLPQEERQRLFEELDRDPATAGAYRRLRDVDKVLRTAPYERAPKALALNIMARIMEGIKQPQWSHLSGLALAVALSLVTLVVVPVLIGLSWLFLSAIGSAAALTGLMNVLVSLLALMIAALNALVQGAQSFLKAYPQTPALMVTLIPVGLYWFAGRTSRKDRVDRLKDVEKS